MVYTSLKTLYTYFIVIALLIQKYKILNTTTWTLVQKTPQNI